MKIISVALLVLVGSFAFAGAVESEKVICGALTYTNGHYVLGADHGHNYSVRKGKLDQASMSKTSLMAIIVQNHNYNESAAPQACFYNVEAERVSATELDVVKVGDVQSRSFIQ